MDGTGLPLQSMTQAALSEVSAALDRVSDETAERMCAEILRARRIVCDGVGREGLMVKALTMRLMDLGLDAHVVGDMTTPPIGKGDLLLASAGPGSFSTVLGLLGVSREAGARTMVVTAQPDGAAPRCADVLIHLPAQTMADDRSASPGLLPMGSLYEIVQLVFFDLIAILLRERMGQLPDEMRARHTNLEQAAQGASYEPRNQSQLCDQAVAKVRKAAKDWGLHIESAFGGLANYCFDGPLHPDPAGRGASLESWMRAFDVTGEVGAKASGEPLGGMSISDASNPNRREQRYRDLLDAVVELSEAARASGLKRLQVECTPLAREIPYNVDQAKAFLRDLDGRCAVEVKLLVDIGHALCQPLYGPGARMPAWLQGLGHSIGAFHLQNTDFQSNSHWGWPDRRGLFDVAGFASEVRDAGLENVPAFIEILYPFELADEQVRENITSSMMHCRREYAGEVSYSVQEA